MTAATLPSESARPDSHLDATEHTHVGAQSSTTDYQRPTNGWIDTFYRAYKGKRLGPYYVRKWRVGRQIKRQYIKAKDLESICAACAANKQARRERVVEGRRHTRSVDNHIFLAAMMNRMDRGRTIHPIQKAHILRLHAIAKGGNPTIYTPDKPPMRVRRPAWQVAQERLNAMLTDLGDQVMAQVFGAKRVFMGAQNS